MLATKGVMSHVGLDLAAPVILALAQDTGTLFPREQRYIPFLLAQWHQRSCPKKVASCWDSVLVLLR